MRHITLIMVLFGAFPALADAPAQRTRIAAICFAAGEQVSGLNKICYYDCMGSQAAITISAVALCPLSINR